jgi:predicted secreted Zn-dependent protease
LSLLTLLGVATWLGPAAAGVTSSIDRRDYAVYGSTTVALVTYMNRHPIQGDHGHAYASIHPTFKLDLKTSQTGGMCKAQVNVNIRFTLTLPTASTSGMTKSARKAWLGFVAFAKAHEEHHRQSYIGCAKDFVTAAERKSAGQCVALTSDIKTMFKKMQTDCEAKQRDFDRAQARVLRNLSLFSAVLRGRH